MDGFLFKAWHKPTSTMYWFNVVDGNASNTGGGYISMTPFGEPITKVRYRDNQVPVDPTDCEILPYSGIKDHQKNRVFAGDIIKYVLHSPEPESPEEYIEEVVFADGGFCVDGGVPLYIIVDAISSEVIGTIYQNPDLLKD